MRTMRKQADLVMTQEVWVGKPSTAWKAGRRKGVGLRAVCALLLNEWKNTVSCDVKILIVTLLTAFLSVASTASVQGQKSDNRPPNIFCNISDGYIYLNAPPLIIYASDVDDTDSSPAIEIFLNGETYKGDPITEAGYHSVRVVARDLAGNSSEYTAEFLVRNTPYLTAESYLLEWQVVPFNDQYFFRGGFVLLGDVGLHRLQAGVTPLRARLCDIVDIGLLILTKDGEIELIEAPIEVCYIPDPDPTEEKVFVYFAGMTKQRVNLDNVEVLRVVGDGVTEAGIEFGFGADTSPVLQKDIIELLSSYRRNCRPQGCRRRPCGPPEPCRWEPEPPIGQTSKYQNSQVVCTDFITGQTLAFWKMQLEAPQSWPPRGSGNAYDRCFGPYVSETHTSGLGHQRKVLKHVNPNDSECYPCNRRWANGNFDFGFTCRAERSVGTPLSIAIVAVAGTMHVATSVGSRKVAGGVQVGSEDPIEVTLQPGGIKVKLTWSSGNANADEQIFFLDEEIRDTPIGGALSVSTKSFVWMRLHCDGAGALTFAEARAWLKDAYSHSHLKAYCERGARGSIRF